MSESKSPVQAKLESELAEAPWSWLAPHCERGAVMLVDPALPLVMVAMAVQGDFVDDVRGWLESGQLARPQPEQLALWQETDPRFRFLIVQPWVLASPAGVES